jgi:hypothetical protein
LLQIGGTRPLPGVLYGITHERDGRPIIREPRVLKVGIGLPRGRALDVWQHPKDGKWYFRIAVKKNGKTDFEFCNPNNGFTREEAEKFYHENYLRAEEVSYPRKLSYFTFTRRQVLDDGTEVMAPDFEAIEAHGPTPRELDIVFLDDNPFQGEYAMWSTSELKCHGDGITALRVNSMAANPEEKALAAQTEKDGSKYFPILGGCWADDCSYSKPVVKGNKEYPSPCKPSGDLKFQLIGNIRVGGTAYYHTSGYRSISQIFSSLERIKGLTGGRLAGIPLKMVLRSYKTKHNGQAATQHGVSLEFRADDVASLRKNLMEQAFRFREAIAPPTRALLQAADESAPVVVEEDDEEHPIGAKALHDEYYATEEEEPQQQQQPRSSAAKASDAKTEALKKRLAEESARRNQSAAAAGAPPTAAEEVPFVDEPPPEEEPAGDPPPPAAEASAKKPGDII